MTIDLDDVDTIHRRAIDLRNILDDLTDRAIDRANGNEREFGDPTLKEYATKLVAIARALLSRVEQMDEGDDDESDESEAPE